MVSARFDTNIIHDLLLNRSPWIAQVALLFAAIDRGEIRACVSASTITDLFYLCREELGLEQARAAIGRCLQIFDVIPVDLLLIREAMDLPIDDLEDAVQLACAIRAELDVIVTRDARGFVDSPVPVCSPAELLARLNGPGPVPSPRRVIDLGE